MPTHDIIDNRNEKLVDHINRILCSTEAARFAVGYFFLSGLTSIAEKLSGVHELRLLIGNTTNRETLEQIAEGYRRLDLVANAVEEEKYPKRTETKRMSVETAGNIQSSIELMDQTDEGEALIKILARMIEEKKLCVRVFSKGRMHAKAYIFDYGKIFDKTGKPIERHEKGIAIVGSSNLTLSGITHNTELNVIVQGNDNHAELVRWFEELWNEASEFDEALMSEMQHSWALAPTKPYDIYLKTIYSLVKDRLEGIDERDILWDDEITRKLADFQKVAVRQGVQMIRDYGGVFISDVVGMGKSYIGAAIVKQFERTEHARPLIICPASLVDMWERYNEVYQLNARVLSIGFLREGEEGLANYLNNDVRFRDRDFVLVDESHNFRYPDTQRYKVVQSFLASGRRSCFLTATPRNKSAWDLYHQIKLFHQDEKTDIPINPPSFKEYFRLIERGEKKLQDLLVHLLVRRTRNHILRWYGYDSLTHQPIDPSRFKEYLDGKKRAYIIVGGKHQFFPKRELATIEYSIGDTYQGLYQQIRGFLGKPRRGISLKPAENELTYARYGLWHYVDKDKQRKEPYASLHRAGANLRGLIRVLLFKRFESSVFAFKETIKKLLMVHLRFAEALSQGIVPAGEDAQAILYEPNEAEERDILEALRKVSGKYCANDFELDCLKGHIEHDIRLLKKILALVEPITPGMDAKLQMLIEMLEKDNQKNKKRLIFTQYADTARYLFENLNPGNKRDDIEVIYSGDKSKAKVVGRFAPKANPEYKFQSGEVELLILVATDVLAEGLNLQDGDTVINYDLHWNPVRLIQRLGRIDRIGSEHEAVYAFNFMPETGIEQNLGLKEKLRNRIQEIHDTIGEDSAILDRSERLNEEAMYAIYEQKGGQLSLFEEEEEFIDLNEAEEILRQMRKDNLQEFDRIANLRDGVRSAKPSEEAGLYVFCQAGRYQQLFILNDKGEITSRDIPKILGTIKCGPELAAGSLPVKYNSLVMDVKNRFAEEVKHRQAERDHSISLTQAQRYVIREIRVSFEATKDEDMRTQLNLLERAFRGVITSAINRELNLLRRNGVSGAELINALSRIYHQHSMKDIIDRRALQLEEQPIPRIICSEALIK